MVVMTGGVVVVSTVVSSGEGAVVVSIGSVGSMGAVVSNGSSVTEGSVVSDGSVDSTGSSEIATS